MQLRCNHIRRKSSLPTAVVALSAIGLLAGIALIPTVAHAQINVGGANPTSYSQNFDTPTLADTGTTAPFVNNGTIPGFYASSGGAVPTTYSVSNGSSVTDAINSYGVNNNPERAFGSLIGAVTNINFGFRIVNTSMTEEITAFRVRYTGEFWRRGGNALNPEQELIFGYAVFDANQGSINATGAYSGFTSLTYRVDDSGPAGGAITAPFSTQSFDRTVVLEGSAPTILPGQELWFRWSDINDNGNDHGLAIDNVQLNFTMSAVVPESSTLYLVVATGALFLLGQSHRLVRGYKKASDGQATR